MVGGCFQIAGLPMEVSRVNADQEGPRRKNDSKSKETAREKEVARRCVIIEKVTIDPNTVPASISYQLLTATVIPRPIGFISSISAAGVVKPPAFTSSWTFW
jgi:hypothetical protein